MIAQIGEVLATYWRRAISSRLAMLATIVPVMGIVEAVLVEQKQIAMAIWMGIYGPAMVALHFKQQIIQIHQRRIPHAVAAHVIVVVGLLVLCGVGLPAARMAIGIWSWGGARFCLRARRADVCTVRDPEGTALGFDHSVDFHSLF